MDRTTIILPEPLKNGLMRQARQERISFAELLRRALQKYLLSQDAPDGDTFLSSHTVFEDDGPTDVAKRHDDYLSGLSPHGTQKQARSRKKKHT